MPLPVLRNWDQTRGTLHQALQILGAVRLLGVDPMPNELQYSLWPTRTGATTGPLSFGGALDFDYGAGRISYRLADDISAQFDLKDHSQVSLADAVVAAIARAGHHLEPTRKRITETAALQLDLDDARAYAEVNYRMYRLLAQLKAHMLGPQTPLVLWPHGFDLSTIWFVEGMNEKEDPQINFGFSPGTPDVGQPYLYFYAWPPPPGLQAKMPAIISWQTDWATPGGAIPYDQFATAADPEALVLPILVGIYRQVSSLLKEAAG